MSVKEMSRQMKDIRRDMEQNEELSVLMASLRGSNLSDADFADSNVKMRLVEVIDGDGGDGDCLPLEYDPDLIADYWGRRPVSLVSRVLQLLGITGGFLSSLLLDYITGDIQNNQVKRAIEIRNIVTSLGPAYIKLGQALSIRPDILSPAAMNEMQKLCDKVPSFDSKIAMEQINTELGVPWTEVYSELSPEPIAAASLGQVYKKTLRSTGQTVAVKVQRPYVLETVTVDLYIIRSIGMFMRRFPAITARADLVALLDEWAARFFEELDYVREGNNATKFAEIMKEDLPQIVIPATIHEYTSRRVLTSEWLDGEKLSQSQADDVGKLVNVGVIAYLKQLLDSGFFHADPHPGNLIRTPDGRLAILDFGLMTQIDDNIKYGMIEAISHLVHRDYDAIVEDFVTLDFIPPGTDLKPILPALARVFDQALEGGGAKSINFQELAADLAQITFDFPFRIPPYFALIIRAIGVLEGIALVEDPDFALVDEAFPYISKRLMTDDSPRLREALRYMVYGKNSVFDADRLIDLLDAFETFTEASKSARGDLDLSLDVVPSSPSGSGRVNGTLTRSAGISSSLNNSLSTIFNGGGGFSPLFSPETLASNPAGALLAAPLAFALAPAAFATSIINNNSNGSFSMGETGDTRTREALKFVFSPEGAFFREFLLDEVVKSIDALSRDQMRQLLSVLGLQNMMVPLLVPGLTGGGGGGSGVVSLAPPLSDEDRAVVENVAKIVNFLAGGSLSKAVNPGALRELVPYLPGLATEVIPELSRRLVSRIAARAVREALA